MSLVGSSRMSSGVGATTAMAKPVRRLIPPDRPPPSGSARRSNHGPMSSSSARSCAAFRVSRSDMPRRRPAISIAARGVSPSIGACA